MYMMSAEPLNDLKTNLESGINQLQNNCQKLSSAKFDKFLKSFNLYINLQIVQDINLILEVCGFYL